MNTLHQTRPLRGLGLSSGGLDSILSALVLRQQGIDVTWIAFETPFFSSTAARKAADQTGIPLITQDITDSYLDMLKSPGAGYGKYMNPCMDCHALMFAKAGDIMTCRNYDFLFSGEVLGQRPKSQTRNALRYVEKQSGFEGRILRPLSARLLGETILEKQGAIDRNQLYDISGRSRKKQIGMAEAFGVKSYPAPAGGCLLTDANFSKRLKDLMTVEKTYDSAMLNLLKYGRHFRLDDQSRVVVGRSESDNQQISRLYDPVKDILIRNTSRPGPDVLMTGPTTRQAVETAAMLCVAYSKSNEEITGRVSILTPDGPEERMVSVTNPKTFESMMI